MIQLIITLITDEYLVPTSSRQLCFMCFYFQYHSDYLVLLQIEIVYNYGREDND
jgi:hypothetical protein